MDKNGLEVWIFKRSAEALQKKWSTPISSISTLYTSK
jgi:hypothetical protein